jgi:hypothetical protein
MRQRLVAWLLVIAFVSPLAAQGYSCAADSGQPQMDMACCQQAKLPTGAAVAKTCCEILCGESPGEAPISNATPEMQVPLVLVLAALPWLTPPARVSVPHRPAPRPAQPCQFPHLYLKNSAFLI